MKRVLLAAAGFLAFCTTAHWAWAREVPAGRVFTPAEIEALLLGKGKVEAIDLAGAPDKMYGVMGEEGVPVNFSAHWEYRPPKMKIVDPGTGKSPATLHIWFDPNDRVERVTLDFAR